MCEYSIKFVFMKNALILHGAGNNSQGNWFPWLKHELEKIGFEVWAPDLPNADEPNQADWLETIFSNTNYEFNDESILIGHSAGSTLILRILERLPKETVVQSALLVAGTVELGTKPEYFQYKKSLVEDPFDWEKIKAQCQNFTFIHSDNDPYECGSNQGEIMHKHLGGNLIVKPGEGHFNLEMGEQYRQFPLVMEIVERECK